MIESNFSQDSNPPLNKISDCNTSTQKMKADPLQHTNNTAVIDCQIKLMDLV